MNKFFYIGTSGWSYQHWINNFYPPSLPAKDWLSYYSEYFNTVELNTSFYCTPFPNMIKSWLNKTPLDFVFSIKASRFITHVKKLNQIEDSMQKQYLLMQKFIPKAHAILYQFPPSFSLNENNLEKLKNLISLLDYNYDNVFEFRHSSWWNEDIESLLLKNKVIFCSVNDLNMPDEIMVTSDSIYIRFHGKHYETLYNEKDLISVKEKIIYIIKQNKELNKIYIYFNNDNNGHAVINARFMKNLLLKST